MFDEQNVIQCFCKYISIHVFSADMLKSNYGIANNFFLSYPVILDVNVFADLLISDFFGQADCACPCYSCKTWLGQPLNPFYLTLLDEHTCLENMERRHVFCLHIRPSRVKYISSGWTPRVQIYVLPNQYQKMRVDSVYSHWIWCPHQEFLVNKRELESQLCTHNNSEFFWTSIILPQYMQCQGACV